MIIPAKLLCIAWQSDEWIGLGKGHCCQTPQEHLTWTIDVSQLLAATQQIQGHLKHSHEQAEVLGRIAILSES